ncbi:MAG TPA: DinB family protein [Candidatus Acidoferrum sp.]|nr:DinB family protein [Candidatus Acidoferrum sp.]
MFPIECAPTRRSFLRSAALFSTAASGLALLPQSSVSADSEENIIGPRPGYSPQIGTLVSMMTWMRGTVLSSVKGLTENDLDHLIDDKANSIGSLLLHLAATDRIYQINTFAANPLKELPESYKEKWGAAMELGDAARKTIKGHDLAYYLNLLAEVREQTLAEFRKRDDNWLMTVDKTWGWGPTNNYCKWFHVCEHESNHNGQIKFLAKRLPGAKPGRE